jgi:hypothetical protein
MHGEDDREKTDMLRLSGSPFDFSPPSQQTPQLTVRAVKRHGPLIDVLEAMFEQQFPLAEAGHACFQLSHELTMQKLRSFSGQDIELDQLPPPNLIESSRKAFFITLVAHNQTPLQVTNEYRFGHGVH